MVEADSDWIKPLELTFKKWKDKIVLCNKYIGRDNGYNRITLDSLVNEKIDFLKADVEGAEIDMLLGAKSILEQSFAKLSICAYHNKNDKNYISNILNLYGYEVCDSRGFVTFLYDPDFYDSLDLRRGLVYAQKYN